MKTLSLAVVITGLALLHSCHKNANGPQQLVSGTTNRVRMSIDSSIYYNGTELITSLYEYDDQGRVTLRTACTAIYPTTGSVRLDTLWERSEWSAGLCTVTMWNSIDHTPGSFTRTITAGGLWDGGPTHTGLRVFDVNGFLLRDSTGTDTWYEWSNNGEDVTTRIDHNRYSGIDTTVYTYTSHLDNREMGTFYMNGTPSKHLIDTERTRSTTGTPPHHEYRFDSQDRVVYDRRNSAQSTTYIYW